MTEQIGFIGLGQMGRRMATRLLDHGHPLVVYDIDPRAGERFRARGADLADGPAALAEATTVVLASLPTPASVADAVLGPGGLAEGFRFGSVFVDLSTTGLEVARKVAGGLHERGVEMLDAPVSGGIAGAQAGTLTVMVAGRRELFERYRGLLQIIGKNIFHVAEEPGLGQAMKLVNNLLSAVAMAASSEALALAAKVGLDPKVAVDIINVSSGRNSATLDKFPGYILERRFDYGFRTDLMVKDVKLAAAMAEQHGAPLFIGRLVEQLWELGVSQGLLEDDFTSIVKLFEQLSGARVGRP